MGGGGRGGGSPGGILMTGNLLGALAKVSGFTLASRITGLVREQLTAGLFGATGMTDAFLVAFRIPNLLRRLFAEGAFSQAFVPLLAACSPKAQPPGQPLAVDTTAVVPFGFRDEVMTISTLDAVDAVQLARSLDDLLDELAEAIIPADEQSGGAKAANVARAIDRHLGDHLAGGTHVPKFLGGALWNAPAPTHVSVWCGRRRQP